MEKQQIKRKRKAGGGRKPKYTCKGVTFTVYAPECAKEEILASATAISDKYLKEV